MAAPLDGRLRPNPGGDCLPLAAIDFYGGAYGPSMLVILTRPESITWLRTVFERVSAASVGPVLDLAKLPRVRATEAVSTLVLSRSARESWRHLVHEATGSFTWTCASDEWRTLSLMLEPLEVGSGHQYLTSEGVDHALVEVTYGEDHAKRGRRRSMPPPPTRD